MSLQAQQPAQIAELAQLRAQVGALSEHLTRHEAAKARLLSELGKSHDAAEKGLTDAVKWQQAAQVHVYLPCEDCISSHVWKMQTLCTAIVKP
jgi:hypothetical protein